MNKVELYGRVANCPDLRETGTEKDFIKILNLTVAVSRPGKDGGAPLADFIPVVAFGKVAENTKDLVKKGDAVIVIGNIRVSQWKDKAGRTKTNFQVWAEQVTLVSKSLKRKKAEKSKDDLPEDIQEFMQLKDGLDDELPFGSSM